MPTKLTVTTDFGTFTRKTARTYTHLVAVKGQRAEWLEARRQESIDYQQQEIRKYQRDLLDVPAARARGRWGDWFTEAWVKEALANCEAALAKLQAEGPITEDRGDWGVLGWCGRFDLAQRLATASDADVYRHVRIVDVATGAVQVVR